MFNILSPLIRLLHCFTKECHSRESGNPLIPSIGKLLLYVNQNMIARCESLPHPLPNMKRFNCLKPKKVLDIEITM
jgi:hypothetical protein